MSLVPISRRELIIRLKKFGFKGPNPGANHSFMIRGKLKLRIPNDHGSDISVGLLLRILKQAGIEVDEWIKR